MVLPEYRHEYDQLLVRRFEAKQRKDFKLADDLRDTAEFYHKKTIADTTEKNPKTGHHYQEYVDMPLARWLRKFELANTLVKAVERSDSMYKTPIKAQVYETVVQ